MRYASIRKMDISNGEGIGVTLFVQGCHFHCHNCFNPETWDFEGGKEWNDDTRNKFIEIINKPYIKRISILGGEPLAEENVYDVLDLLVQIKKFYPKKSIWLYTGYKIEDIFPCLQRQKVSTGEFNEKVIIRQEIVRLCDVLIDGQYDDSLKDISLHWKGSSNQRVINVDESIKKMESIVLYGE